jgi:soluble lytic murein transglycosylase-like protein
VAQWFERRMVERRQGRRRSAARGGSDRRRAHRRVAVGAALAVASLSAGARTAAADIYTRINSKGVLEATNAPASPQGFKLAYRSKGTLVHSAGFRMRASSNSEFNHHIDAAADLYGVSRNLVRAIIQVESAFDSLAVSTAGARGLMQLMPATARRFLVTNSFDARQNIFAGTRYLRILLDAYGGDVSLSAAAYNAGEGAVARYNGIPPFQETRDYVRKVNDLLGGAVDGLASDAPAALIAPGQGKAPKVPTSRPTVPVVKRPSIYYRWKDANGVFHMEQEPPATGEYTTIRSIG